MTDTIKKYTVKAWDEKAQKVIEPLIEAYNAEDVITQFHVFFNEKFNGISRFTINYIGPFYEKNP